MVDMHARWYSPQIGRFTTADPYRGDLHTPHTQNRYAYVGNNPINYWDPLGYWRDGDELLSPQAQAAIWVLTDMYYATNDPAEQDSIRAQANEIRRLDTTRIEYQTTDFIGSSTSNDRYYLPEVKVAFGYNTDWVNIYVVYSEYGIYSNLKNAYTQEVVSKIQIGSITYTDTTVTTGTDFRPFTPKEWYEENKGILDGYGMLPPASSTTTSTKTTSSSTTTNYNAKQIEARLLTAQKANSASVIVGPDTAKHLAYIKIYDSTIRALTPEEMARSKRSERISKVPIVSTANKIKISMTGSDLEGYIKNEGEIQRAKEGLAVDAALVVIGGTVLKETGAITSITNSINTTLTKIYVSTTTAISSIVDKVFKGTSTTTSASTTTREALLEATSNQKLKNAIDQIYRPGATTGDGGLADAIRHQLSTGELVGGKDHLIKGAERVKNLENIISKEALSSSDLNLAQKLLNDLKSALGGK